LSKNEFDNLAVEDSESLNVYRKYSNNSSTESYTSMEVKKISETEFKANGKTYKLQYKEVKIEKVNYRKPHPIVKNNWDERVKKIKESINEQETTLNRYVREDLAGIRTNLFVRPEYANVVETKLNELRTNLAAMTLEADKTKDYYEKVGNNTQITEAEPA
jgi:hypothetical protein